MYCQTIRVPGGHAVICGDKSMLTRRKCEFCKRRLGTNQCDYLMGGECPKCKGKGHLDPLEILIKEKRITRAQAESPTSSLRDVAEQMFPGGMKCHDCAGTGKEMCNRYFCALPCGIAISQEEGYCPEHLELAGHKPKRLRERCYWLRAKRSGPCLRKSCVRIVEPNERCLYFPARQRMMHALCGEEYLQLTVPIFPTPPIDAT